MKICPAKRFTVRLAAVIRPMVEHEPQMDDLNPYPWYDITSGTCYSVIATIQIVPDDKPIEPSKAMEPAKPRLVSGRAGRSSA
jgi:hypothetical protein